jgi:hypothetical protein
LFGAVRVRLKDLFVDIFGSAVAPRSDSRLTETPLSVLIAGATVVSSLATLRDFAVETLGLGGAFVPLLVSLVVLAASLFTVTARIAVADPPGFGAAAPPAWRYKYGTWTRRFAKASLLASVFLVPMHVRSAIEQIVPLPAGIAGVLVDGKTRRPVEGARIRLVLPNGVDVTGGGDFPSDSHGVFVLRPTRPIRRNAVATVYRDDCKPASVPLWKRFETAVPDDLPYVARSTSPFFTFAVECN